MVFQLWESVDDECRTEPSEPVLFFVIQGWDFEPGTFVVGEATPEGTALAGTFSDPDRTEIIMASGTVTVEPFDERPGRFSWDLDIGSGGTDTSVCHDTPEGGC
jgi:hypothetical protein